MVEVHAPGSGDAANQVAVRFDYLQWAWELLKPADLFTPSNELTPTEERVAVRLWAHASMRTGFTYVSAARIAALLARDLESGRQAGSLSQVTAARAVLRRRHFIERAEENGRKGWRLLHPSRWRHRSGECHDQEAGPKTRAARVSPEAENSRCANEKLALREFRPLADSIEGTDQGTLPFLSGDNAGGQNTAAKSSSSQISDAISKLISLGADPRDAVDLVAEFDLVRLSTAIANLEFDRARGKPISTVRGYIADQVRNRRPKKQGVPLPVSHAPAMARAGEFQ